MELRRRVQGEDTERDKGKEATRQREHMETVENVVTLLRPRSLVTMVNGIIPR